jgi:hypothetical protein
VGRDHLAAGSETTTMFNFDWFNGRPFQQQREEARQRCAARHFPDLAPELRTKDGEFQKFLGALETRCLVYLRDGFSYEFKGFAEVDSKTHLTFECEPVDDQYKVGAFVVTVPFEEIVRVEVFAVHPSEKPDEMPQITGFRAPLEPEGPRQPDRRMH